MRRKKRKHKFGRERGVEREIQKEILENFKVWVLRERTRKKEVKRECPSASTENVEGDAEDRDSVR